MAALEADRIVKLAHDLPADEDASVSAVGSFSAGGFAENGSGPSASGGKTVRKTADVKIDEAGIGFESFMLKDVVLKGLKRANYVRPSPIQLKAIPPGRIGMDLVVQAKSGTGKTCVFTVLALEMVEVMNPAPQVLILAPTREIAVQITDTLTTVGHYMLETKENEFTGVKSKTDGIRVETFIGGTSVQYDKDKARLKKCQIVVGTPGRILQLISEGYLSTEAVRLFVMDEADKLMEDSYQTDINAIYAHLPSGKQLVVTSATYPRQLDEFLSRYMKTPTRVQLDAADVQLTGVKQYLLTVIRNEDDNGCSKKDFESWLDRKIEFVNRLLSRVSFEQCLIFSAFQDKVETLAKKLATAYKWPVTFIGAQLSQTQRMNVLRRLQNFQIRILVSTDLTARGIDAEKVNLVINFDLPYDAESYFHRIGRAGRFGGYGAAVTLAFNHTEEMKFYSLAAKNDFKVKKLPAISEIPSNLPENDQYYASLPKLELPDSDTMERFLAKQSKTGKPTHRWRNNENTGKSAPVGDGGMDEYTKLMLLSGPTERWSPTDYILEEVSNGCRCPIEDINGKRREYSRTEMLSILKDNLSSLPSSRTSVVAPQSLSEKEAPSPPSDQVVKGHRIDVSALFSYFKENPAVDTSSNILEEISKEGADAKRSYAEASLPNLEQKLAPMEKPSTSGEDIPVEAPPPIRHYGRETLLMVRPLIDEAYAENVFNMEALRYTFKKKKAKKPVAETPAIKKYSREEILTIRPLGTRAYARRVFDFRCLAETFGRQRRPQEETRQKSFAILQKQQAEPIDIRKDYDRAIIEASQSQFYQFFGGCALQLQTAAVEARKTIPKEDKEVQTEEFATPVTRPVSTPGWKTVSYDRDQMLEMWKMMANPAWSYKRRLYPWTSVVVENGLLVDRKFGEAEAERLEDEHYGDGEQEEAMDEYGEEEYEAEEDAKEIINQYSETLAEYRETLKLYKKCMIKYHM